jgi:medium-chain acyl-[acyl-carrier-protein] hydrolase
MAVRALPRRQAAEGTALRERLFCFPYAGAGAGVFRDWPGRLPPHVEVCVACLPGRDARIDEPPLSSMARLAQSLAQDMIDWLGLPYSLFGHSMGAFVAFEVAHALSRLGRPPAHLFVSAQRGPRLPYAGQPIFALPDRDFLAGVLARYDRIPKQVLEQKDLMAVLLRTLRADFTLSEDYRYRAATPLMCPITAFGGSQDSEVTSEQLEAWSAETAGGFKLHMLAGDHFFLQGSQAELLSLIRIESGFRDG